jgi:hypothetical protein
LEHLLNAEFDLSLRPRWRRPGGESARRRITDLQWHALFLAECGDSVVVPEPAPEDFVGYLERNGIELPVLTVDPDCRTDRILSPLGWNTAAGERNRRHDRRAEHPHLDAVRRANGRTFSAGLETELFGDDHTIATISSEAELRAVLEGLPDMGEGLVLKAEHGNAGLGNRRLQERELSEGDATVVRRFFDEDLRAVLEWWRPRILDLCSTFTVLPGGGMAGFRLHEVVNTADGAFIGALFHEDATRLERWRPALVEAATTIARSVARVGYIGPACTDAFVWDDNGEPRLRPLVDLNARREMSAGASSLWRRLGGEGTAYWRFYTRRKIVLPDSYDELDCALGGDAYDPSRRRGVLVTAPLWLGNQRRSAAKAAVFFLGDDPDDARALDARFRRRFER